MQQTLVLTDTRIPHCVASVVNVHEPPYADLCASSAYFHDYYFHQQPCNGAKQL